LGGLPERGRITPPFVCDAFILATVQGWQMAPESQFWDPTSTGAVSIK